MVISKCRCEIHFHMPYPVDLQPIQEKVCYRNYIQTKLLKADHTKHTTVDRQRLIIPSLLNWEGDIVLAMSVCPLVQPSEFSFCAYTLQLLGDFAGIFNTKRRCAYPRLVGVRPFNRVMALDWLCRMYAE